jgi:hypothetical protein
MVFRDQLRSVHIDVLITSGGYSKCRKQPRSTHQPNSDAASLTNAPFSPKMVRNINREVLRNRDLFGYTEGTRLCRIVCSAICDVDTNCLCCNFSMDSS